MNQWILLKKGADFQTIGEKYHIDPLIVRLIRNRGIETEQEIEQYLYAAKESFHDPFLLKDMDKACELLVQKLLQERNIRVIGDYDIDGVCSTAILLKGLQFLGAKADAVIPHRVQDGYGLNRKLIDSAYEDGIDTVVTCDNGIAAREEIAYAASLGMTVVVTDHHEVPYEETEGKRKWLLPDAAAVVDPKREDCAYPYAGICGAVVAYKLVCAMVQENYIGRLSMQEGWKDRWEKLDRELLQLAAFATVGDVMELKDENRALVKEGLQLMTNTESVGLKALLSVMGLWGQPVTAYHLGFLLGPCINATGRIDTASRALELLMAEQEAEAMRLAGDLKAMNDSRKTYTEQGTKEAIEQIEQGMHDGESVYVIYLPKCHESIAGIVAGRIRERYHRPTLVVTDTEEGLKGSGRSIDAYHMYEELSKVRDIFTKFGGHAQAAGFSLPKEKLPELTKRLNENCTLTETDFREKIYIDADMPFSYMTPKLLDEFSLLEPFGNGNTKPLFARKNLLLLGARLLGAEGKVGKYRVMDTNQGVAELTLFFDKNVAFRNFLIDKYGEKKVQEAFHGKGGEIRFSAAFYPQWNEYQGKRTIQFIMEDYC